MDLHLAGKTAVVTGGSLGIGLAIARAFLVEGAKVAICARREEELHAAERGLSDYGIVLPIRADMTSEPEVYAFADAVVAHFGRIDCWVNNVGATVPRQGEGFTVEEIRRTTAVCFDTAVLGCQAAYRHMKGRGGAIVNISSLAARCGTAGRSTLYGPLKAAVRQLSVMFAAEYAADGVRVNCVLPGFTATPAVRRNISPEELERNARGTLLRRVAEPDEIAKPVVFLCSDAASYVTAASLEVSGGRSVVLNPEYAYERAGQA
ncbi:MAG: SDR family oxidoreductase [Clostridiales bacterium]|nr:SDR family oxidoreductase [Clostridiales bacterium]